MTMVNDDGQEVSCKISRAKPRKEMQVAEQFLSSSPPGQVNIVLRDLQSLVPDADYTEMVKEYHMNANSIFDKMVLSKHGNKGDFSFDDPNAQAILELDPINFTLLNSSSYQVEEVERRRVQDEADKYVKSFYSKGIATVYGGPSQYVIFISSEKYNPDNYWNGKWVSEWKIHLDQNRLQGSLKIHIHYFEDGNVQLKQSKSVDLNVEDNSIKNMFKAIQTAEQEIHTNLIMACSALCDKSFKGLRRALPLTKAKMDWRAIGNYKIGSELDKS